MGKPYREVLLDRVAVLDASDTTYRKQDVYKLTALRGRLIMGECLIHKHDGPVEFRAQDGSGEMVLVPEYWSVEPVRPHLNGKGEIIDYLHNWGTRFDILPGDVFSVDIKKREIVWSHAGSIFKPLGSGGQ